MTTLSDLRALLERAFVHGDNPAILRLPEGERTVEGLARAYLARWVSPVERRYVQALPVAELVGDEDDMKSSDGQIVLRLTDPGTAHALLIALALSHGHDPGQMALEVMLSRIDEPTRRINDEEQEDPVVGWFLYTADGGRSYTDDDEDPAVCAIAREPDPIKALCLAVRHVLEAP